MGGISAKTAGHAQITHPELFLFSVNIEVECRPDSLYRKQFPVSFDNLSLSILINKTFVSKNVLTNFSCPSTAFLHFLPSFLALARRACE